MRSWLLASYHSSLFSSQWDGRGPDDVKGNPIDNPIILIICDGSLDVSKKDGVLLLHINLSKMANSVHLK